MTKDLFADDLEEASILHREALAKIVFDMAVWLKRTRTDRRRAAARLRQQGRMAEAREKAESADALSEAFEHLKMLRNQHGEQSARRSVSKYQTQETGNGQHFTDPTPEEIAKQCEEIRQRWSENEAE